MVVDSAESLTRRGPCQSEVSPSALNPMRGMDTHCSLRVRGEIEFVTGWRIR